MTNREAADELQYAINLIKQDGKDWLDERDIPILEAAISALQAQELSETQKALDTISRQAAIDVLDALDITDGVGISSIACDLQEEAIRGIQKLPSVQPELIEQGAYVRGFEQGRTQGMIDAQGEKDEQTKKGRHYYDVQRFGNNC